MLYLTHDSLSKSVNYCESNGLTFDIERIRELDGKPAGRYGLTEEQYKALTKAADHGYYDISYDIELQELANDLDITHQALSERLRRETLALIEDTLLIGPRSDE